MSGQDGTVAPDAFRGKLVVAPRFHRQWMLAGNPAHFIDRLISEHGDFVLCRGIIGLHLINHPELAPCRAHVSLPAI